MQSNLPSQRYNTWSIALHWLMLALLVAVYASMELRGYFPKGSATRDGMKTWHYMLGLSVFVLVWTRLVARIVFRRPPIVPAEVAWQAWAAAIVHVALYALMIGMPLLGWLLLSADGKPIPFFGLELPALIGANDATAKFIEELHETGGNIGYGLVALHAAAALFHHYVVRDNTLLRMLPAKRT